MLGILKKHVKFGMNNQKERDLWIENNLRKIPKGKKLLDVGAGECRYKEYCSHLKYTSQDFAQYNSNEKENGLHPTKWNYDKIDIVSDILNIPVEDEKFDYIMCTEVLEHILYPIDALKELSRILKKGGVLILTAPFCSLTHFAPYHYYTGYNHYFYVEILKKVGFDLVEIKPYGNYFEYIGQELRRIPHMGDRYLIKHNFKFKIFFYPILLLNLLVLGFFSKYDKESSELLCYGYCVTARKK